MGDIFYNAEFLNGGEPDPSPRPPTQVDLDDILSSHETKFGATGTVVLAGC